MSRAGNFAVRDGRIPSSTGAPWPLARSSMASRSACARWTARRPVPGAICSRQLKPSATISVSAVAFRTAGRRTSSPLHVVDQAIIQAFQANRPEFETTRAILRSASMLTTRLTYFDMSMTTGGIATLTGEARASSARENRRAVPAADIDRRDHIVQVTRHDDADGHLPIVGGVGRIERSAAAIESHVCANRPAKIVGKIAVELLPRGGLRTRGQCRSRHSRAPQIIAAPPATRPNITARCSFAHVCGLAFVVRAPNRPSAR